MSRVLLAVEEQIATITLNDPENLNAMGEAMAADFRATLDRLRERIDEVRAIVLTGSGRAFSAGGNLQMLEAKTKLSKAENERRMLEFYRSFLDILDLRVPLIAAVNGHAIGAGLCVACACDVRIVAHEAKLGFTFTKLGLHPGMGATFFLPRVIGLSRATELMCTGRVINGDEAHTFGLASRVSDSADVLREAYAVAREVLACGPLSVRQLLESLRPNDEELAAALRREAACQSENYAGAEFAEGVRAAIEKRTPRFS